MKRVLLRVLCATVAVVWMAGASLPGGLAVCRAETVRISIVQLVEHPALDAVLRGFEDDLRENVKGVEFTEYNAHGNIGTVNQIAVQMAGDAPDMMLAIATPPAQACARMYDKVPHLAKTPMLFSAITDPMAAGLVSNYERPGGNISGVSNMMPMDKHIDMVRRFLPKLKVLGVMYNAGEMNSVSSVRRLRAAAEERGITLLEAPVSSSADVYQGALSLVGRADAVYVPADNTVVAAVEGVVKICEKSGLPLFTADTDSVARGAVAALGFDYYEHGRQTGAMARRILAGTPVGEMPVEFQKNFGFHVNPGAAKRMGLVIPDEVLRSADKLY